MKIGRVAKTRAWFQNRDAFKQMLAGELHWWRTKARDMGLTLCFRPNVFSDIPWEKVWPDLFVVFSDVVMYDYTKDFRRAVNKTLPKNYDLTFSRSEINHKECLLVLKRGGRVAVPFGNLGMRKREPMPKTFEGYPVVNGDEDDLRFLDPKGVWIGLYSKAKGQQDETGFIVPTEVRQGKRVALIGG